MHLVRVVLVIPFLLLTAVAIFAQQPGPEFLRKLSCIPYEPRTQLESLESKVGVVVLRGFSQMMTTEVRGVRIDAVEMRMLGTTVRAKGIVFVLRENPERPEDNRAFVDYQDIDELVKAIDTLAAVDENSTKLVGFEAHYRTVGDLELRVFRQTQRGTAVTLQTGICNHATQSISLDELAKVKALILEAKGRLDQIR